MRWDGYLKNTYPIAIPNQKPKKGKAIVKGNLDLGWCNYLKEGKYIASPFCK